MTPSTASGVYKSMIVPKAYAKHDGRQDAQAAANRSITSQDVEETTHTILAICSDAANPATPRSTPTLKHHENTDS